MKVKRVMHLMTQDDQPIGSRRNCCEKCGQASRHWPKGDSYVDREDEFTKETAIGYGFVRCGDQFTN